MDFNKLNLDGATKVVYLGCGELLPESFTLPTTCNELTLVDSSADIVDRLQTLYTSYDNITCTQCYVAVNSQVQPFNYYNLTKFNGFGDEKHLKQLYPGLKLRSTETVKPTDICDLVDQCALNPQENNALVLDIPSLNTQLVKRLFDAGKLHTFRDLRIIQGSDKLFSNEETANELQKWLMDVGYLVQQYSTDDVDFTLLNATVNPLYIENAKLHVELSNKKQQLDELQKQFSDSQKHLEQLTAVNAKNEELERTLVVERQAVSARQQRIEQQDADLEKHQRQMRINAEELNSCREQLKMVSSHQSKLEEALAAEQKATQAKEMAFEESEQQCVLLQQQLNETQQSLNSAQQHVEQQVVAFKETQHQLEQHNAELRDQITSLKQALEDKQQAIQAKEMAIEESGQQCVALQQQVSETQKALQKEQQKLKDTEQRQAQLEAELNKTVLQVQLINELLLVEK